MTQDAGGPWAPWTQAELTEMDRQEAVRLGHAQHVPARNAAERLEYDRIDEANKFAAEVEERNYHFYGYHVQDPSVPHFDCVYSCPYDTPEQARARDLRWRPIERQEAPRAAELEAGC